MWAIVGSLLSSILGGGKKEGGGTSLTEMPSSASGQANSAMYGNFATGDFSVGGAATSGSTLLMVGIGALAITIILLNWKKHKKR
jgi:hypothetical protein